MSSRRRSNWFLCVVGKLILYAQRGMSTGKVLPSLITTVNWPGIFFIWTAMAAVGFREEENRPAERSMYMSVYPFAQSKATISQSQSPPSSGSCVSLPNSSRSHWLPAQFATRLLRRQRPRAVD